MYLGLWLPHIHQKVAKGINPLALALEGVALALMFGIAVAVGKRIWVGFAGLAVTFGPLSKYVILAMPAVAFATFAGFRYIMQPKNPRALGAKRERANAPKASNAVPARSKIQSARYTQPKSSKAKSQRNARSTYGTLGRLGPGGANTKDTDA